MLDLDLDPVTRDLTDAADGGFVEASDSRTAVLWQLEEKLGATINPDGTGSRVRELLERLEPASEDELRDAALEALQRLVDEHVIADLLVEIAYSAPGQGVFELAYTDVATGRRLEDLVVPFGGA